MLSWRSLARFVGVALFVTFGATTFAIATPTKYTIHIKDFVFRPGTMHVHTGDSVTYINDDDNAHTVTADDQSFDSKDIDSKGQWTYIFNKPGKYTYHCSLHKYVHGEIDADSP
jgi:plastocyanin